MGAIYRRELGSFFNSAIGPVFLTVFYLGSGVLFWLFCLNYARTDMSNYFAWMRLVMVLILPLLPAGNIRFHGHNALANIAHRFVHRHGDNVNGKHHVPGIVHQLRDHLVGNKAGILPQEQSAPHMIAQLIVIFLKGNTVRGDAVPEVMPLAYGVLQIEAE